MKVLHILNELKFSGAEIMLKLAAPFWRAEGLELSIWSRGESEGVYASYLREAGYRILSIPARTKAQLNSGQVLEQVKPLLESTDITHIHTDSLAGTVASMNKRYGGHPALRTVHNNFDFDAISKAWLWRAYDRFRARQKGVAHVAISPSVRDNEWARFRNPTTLIGNWIDVAHFRAPSAEEKRQARQRLQIPDEHRVVVSVGNSNRQKNYAALIEGMSMTSESRLHYYQVGNPHPDGLDRSAAQAFKVADRVHFMGPTTEPRDWLWAADIYLMPSLYEGFGLAAAEALVTGIPSVFSRVIGLKDWAETEADVIWCDTGAASIAKAIMEVSEGLDAGRYAQTDAVSQSLRHALSPERGAREYLDFYRKLLK